jgi:tetratricopeptide (TPR) repeat protein
MQVVIALVLGAWMLIAMAHEDTDQQIVHLDRAIQHDPQNEDLHLRRAHLLRYAEHWREALESIAAARKAGATLEADFAAALVYADAKQPERAWPLLDTILSRQPEHHAARERRANIATQLHKWDVAAADYTQLASQPSVKPELYLAWAEALRQQHSPRMDEALAVLYLGIQRLGPIAQLSDTALAWEMTRENYTAALALWMQTKPRQGSTAAWHVQYGDILTKAKRFADAREAYRYALFAIEQLPPARRQTAATEALALRAQDGVRLADSMVMGK